ncbi:EexN family lipoprotein [Pseudomonas amygdali]|uniref:EexN family lipoprotein n=1 Tax=Pseudomonas amygdali TaxID=47877 RepID=UPI0007609404|nr:EexN family lipoprotein [Pseudomonas amygdali]KWS54912.1 hypothetical protein AL055_08745 [Pseudomonas amygdali pv. morsprunorum]POD00974.1 hypothetical protein BKM20_25395 [Pseudomonas avellanae]
MKKAMVVCGVLGFVLLSGCSDEVKTRAWYMDHPKELAEVFAKCKASGDDTPNCRNAIEAQFRVKQSNAPVPTFRSSTDSESSNSEYAKIQAFKMYNMSSVEGRFTYSFPESLQGKTIQDIENGNYKLSEDERAQVQKFCKKLDSILAVVHGKDSFKETKTLEYACKQFKF